MPSLYADFLDGWLVAPGDGFAHERIRVEERPLLMSSVSATAEIAGAALAMAGVAVTSYSVFGVEGMPEVAAGDDLAALILATGVALEDGDILLVTSKIVSKAEGRVLSGVSRESAIEAETVRVVAARR